MIWIGDSRNNAIRLITSDYQNVFTVAGLGIESAQYADGNVKVAMFNRPWQFFMTKSGVSLIADGFNNMIRGINFFTPLIATTKISSLITSSEEQRASTKLTTTRISSLITSSEELQASTKLTTTRISSLITSSEELQALTTKSLIISIVSTTPISSIILRNKMFSDFITSSTMSSTYSTDTSNTPQLSLSTKFLESTLASTSYTLESSTSAKNSSTIRIPASKTSYPEIQSLTRVTTNLYPTPDKTSTIVTADLYAAASITAQSYLMLNSRNFISSQNSKSISLTLSLYKSVSTFIPSTYIVKYMNSTIKPSQFVYLSMPSHADTTSSDPINSHEYKLEKPSPTTDIIFGTYTSRSKEIFYFPTEKISTRIILPFVPFENSTISQSNATLRYNHISSYNMLYYARLLPQNGGLLCYSLILIGLAFGECAKIVEILILKLKKRKSIIYIVSMLGLISTLVNCSFYFTYLTMDIVYEKISVQTISAIALSLSVSNKIATFLVYTLIGANIIQFHMVLHDVLTKLAQ